MKKANSKKLRLSRETLRALASSDLPQVVGASGGIGTSCPSACPGGGVGICPTMDQTLDTL
jgi:hypothetical protein